jgi:hypothetical protein
MPRLMRERILDCDWRGQLANGVWANGYFAQRALCGATIIGVATDAG